MRGSRQIDERVIGRVRMPSVLQAERGEMGMRQCFLFAEARDNRGISLSIGYLWRGVGLAILRCDVGIGHEHKPRVDSGRDA